MAGGTHRKTRTRWKGTRWKGRRYSQKDKNPVEGQEARALVSPNVDLRVRVQVSEDVVNVGPYPLQGTARITHQIKTRWVVFLARDSQTMTVSVMDSQTMTVSVRDRQTMTVSVRDSQTMTVSVRDSQTMTVSVRDNQTMTVSVRDSQTMTVSVRDSQTMAVSVRDSQAVIFLARDSPNIASDKDKLGRISCKEQSDKGIFWKAQPGVPWKAQPNNAWDELGWNSGEMYHVSPLAQYRWQNV